MTRGPSTRGPSAILHKPNDPRPYQQQAPSGPAEKRLGRPLTTQACTRTGQGAARERCLAAGNGRGYVAQETSDRNSSRYHRHVTHLRVNHHRLSRHDPRRRRPGHPHRHHHRVSRRRELSCAAVGAERQGDEVAARERVEADAAGGAQARRSEHLRGAGTTVRSDRSESTEAYPSLLGLVRVNRGLSESTGACPSQQRLIRVKRGLSESTGACPSLLGLIRVYCGLSESTEAYPSLQRLIRVYWGLSESTEAYPSLQRLIRVYRGLSESTEAYPSLQRLI